MLYVFLFLVFIHATFALRIVTFGSLYSDITHTKELFKSAELADSEDNWVARDTTAIAMGNAIGVGADTKDVLNYLYSLQDQAARKQSQLILLFGQEEVRTLIGNYNNVHPTDIQSYGGADKRKFAFLRDTIDGLYLRRKFIALYSNEPFRTLFSHGLFKYSRYSNTPNYYNKQVPEFDKFFEEGQLIEALAIPFTKYDPKTVCSEVKTTLKVQGMDRLIVSVNSKVEKYGVHCDGKLINIEMPASVYYRENVLAFTEMTDEGIFEVKNGQREKISAITVHKEAPKRGLPSDEDLLAGLFLGEYTPKPKLKSKPKPKPQNPPEPPVEPKIDPKAMIYAIGDIHGDYYALIEILKMLHLIDDTKKWIGGTSILVQIGDIVDRGPHGIHIWNYLIVLKRQAIAAGGMIECILGNHEVMNIMGDFSLVSIADIHQNGGDVARKKAIASGTKIGNFLRSMNIVAVYGETVFVHGGLLPRYAELGVDKMNAMARERTLKFSSYQSMRPDDILRDYDGPLWLRDFSDTDKLDGEVCPKIEKSLANLGVKRMVVGHTIKPSITSRCDGKYIMIDVGISRFMGMRDGTPRYAALRINPVKGHVDAVYPDDEIEPILSAAEMFKPISVSDKVEHVPVGGDENDDNEEDLEPLGDEYYDI